jgi:hypothetical protein
MTKIIQEQPDDSSYYGEKLLILFFGILMIYLGIEEYTRRGICGGFAVICHQKIQFHELKSGMFLFVGIVHLVGIMVFSQDFRWGNVILSVMALMGVFFVGLIIVEGVIYHYGSIKPFGDLVMTVSPESYTSPAHIFSFMMGLFLIRLYIKRILGAQH